MEGEAVSAPRLFDGRRKQWFSVDNIVVDEYLPKIGDKAFSLYCVLARMAENETGKCFPRQSVLERLLGWSNSTVRRALRTLVEWGLVQRVERFRDDTDGSQMANDYYLVDVQARSPQTTPPVSSEQGGGRGGTAFKKTQTRTPRQEDSSDSNESVASNAPSNASPAPEPDNTALTPVFVGMLAKGVEDMTVPCDAPYKTRFGRDVKRELKKGTDPETIDHAVKRIIERWDDYQLSLRQALTDITNKKTVGTTQKKEEGTPEEGIERIRRGNGLARYATVAERFDFTSDAQPPWYVMKELGGTPDEQQRNLTRIRTLVGQSGASAQPVEPVLKRKVGVDTKTMQMIEWLEDAKGNQIEGSHKLYEVEEEVASG